MNRIKSYRQFVLFFLSLFLIQCVQKERRPTATPASHEKKPASIENTIENRDYEICHTPSKNYLEKQILEKVDRTYYLQNHQDDWEKKIPIKCIQLAQKNFRGSYAYCEDQFAKPAPQAPRPCLTENYTTLVYNAYHDVKNCFNLDPRRSFLQIMIESGFHINAINKTGFDAGISQFTKNGILRVLDNNLVNKTRQQLILSSSPSCQRISNVFDDLSLDAAEKNQRCSMMSVPQNPYRALVLHYLHTLKDQIFFKNEFLSKRPEVAGVVDQEILEQFVYMAYNRGITGTLQLIDGYVASRKKVNATITTADLNLMQNLSEARKILKEEPAKRVILKNSKKILKLSFAEYTMIHDKNYLLVMAEARDFVKSKIGEDCF